MELRALRAATALWLAIYLPIETWLSWPALWHPLYLIDAAGMGLLAWGVARAGRSGPQGAIILASGWAWTAANFWRGTAARFAADASGLPLAAGGFERWVGVALTAVAIVLMAVALRASLSRPQ